MSELDADALATIRADHTSWAGNDVSCGGCMRDWPCPVARLADAYDAQTADLAREREHNRRLVERWRGRVDRAEQQYQALEAERDRANRTEMIGAELLTRAVRLRAELEAERGRVERLRVALCDARREVESVKVGDSLWNLQARREALRLIDEVLSAAEEGQSV